MKVRDLESVTLPWKRETEITHQHNQLYYELLYIIIYPVNQEFGNKLAALVLFLSIF